jgi:glycerol-3-phosphate dehydrogenase
MPKVTRIVIGSTTFEIDSTDGDDNVRTQEEIDAIVEELKQSEDAKKAGQQK